MCFRMGTFKKILVCRTSAGKKFARHRVKTCGFYSFVVTASCVHYSCEIVFITRYLNVYFNSELYFVTCQLFLQKNYSYKQYVYLSTGHDVDQINQSTFVLYSIY